MKIGQVASKLDEKQKSFFDSPFNGIDYVVHLGRVNLTEDRFQNHLQK